MSRHASLARAVTAYAPLSDLVARATSTTGGDCAPCAAALTAAAPAPAGVALRWEGVIGIEGELTGDGRLIENGSLRWENLPIPIRLVTTDVGAHDGAVTVGNIETIDRRPGGKLWATGTFDGGSDMGREAFRLVDEEIQNGVSMDLDDVSFEIRVAKELIDEMDALMAEPADPEADQPEEVRKVDADGRVTVMEMNSDDEVMVTTDGRVRAATIVAIPAFAGAKINTVAADAPAGGMAPPDCSCDPEADNYDPDCQCPEDAPAPPADNAAAAADVLVASAIPVNPPAAWFNRPTFDGPTPMRVTEEGQVYGHIATWDSCHIAHSSNGACVTPPRSATGYAYFLTGAVLTAEGAEIPVGHLTMNTRHAGDKLSLAATLAHYEDTGVVAADVAVWEDAWGIAFAGALRPTMTPTRIREFRAAPLSGDWRRAHGNLELVAALAVNVPGFPIPRPAARVSGGEVTSMVASGMLPPSLIRLPGTRGAPDEDDLRYLRRLADRERHAESAARSASAALARRVRASQLAMRVNRPGKD